MSLTRRLLVLLLVLLCVLGTSAAAGLFSYLSIREGHAFAPKAVASLTLMTVFVPIVYVAWPVPVGISAGLFALLMQLPLLSTPTAIPWRSRILAWSCLGLTPVYFLCLVLFRSFDNRILIIDGGLHAGWIAALALLAVGIRRRPSVVLNAAFHGVLYAGLFYCAFPYLPLSELGTWGSSQ